MSDSMIFVVRGSTGEYSDRDEWPVVAFEIEDAAREHVELATQAAKAIEASGRDIAKGDNPYDPECDHMGYTGNTYWYERVELRASVGGKNKPELT